MYEINMNTQSTFLRNTIISFFILDTYLSYSYLMFLLESSF